MSVQNLRCSEVASREFTVVRARVGLTYRKVSALGSDTRGNYTGPSVPPVPV